MRDQGALELRSSQDVLAKMRRDYNRICTDQCDSGAALDFFVTANHMAEWFFLGVAKRANDLRRQTPLLRICEHLANAAKHYRPTDFKDGKNQAVEDGGIRLGSFASAFSAGFDTAPRLTVMLTEEFHGEFGPSIRVSDLARRVLTFWEAKLTPQGDS